MSMFIVSSIASPMFVQPASAQSYTDMDDDDPWSEELGEVGCAAGGLATSLFPQCSVEYGDVDGATAEQVHYDIATDATFMDDTRQQVVVEKQSYIEQTQGMALAQAKIETVECMNEGNSQAVCNDEAQQEVAEVMATVQKSLFVSQNRQVQHWQIMEQQRTQTDNLTFTEIYPYDPYSGDYEVGFDKKTVQLYDGEEMEVMVGSLSYESPEVGPHYLQKPYYYNGNLEAPTSNLSDAGTENNINVVGPEGKTYIALDGGQYKTALTTLDDKHNSAISATNKMVDSIFSNYDQGEITTEEIAGPLETIVAGQGTTNDPLTYRLMSAKSAGYAVNDSGKTVDVEADLDDDGSTETKSGVIYADDGTFPNNEIKTGTTYVHSDDGNADTVQLNGSVTFISNPSESEPDDYPLDSKQFTVQQVYNADGNETSSMTLESNDFNTTNTDKLNEQIADLRQQMQELEESYDNDNTIEPTGDPGGYTYPGTGDGGLFGGGSGIVQNLLGGLGIGFALVIVGAVMIGGLYLKIILG